MISCRPMTFNRISELMSSVGFSSEHQNHPSNPLMTISRWMSSKHLKLKVSQSELLIFTPYPPPPPPPTAFPVLPPNCKSILRLPSSNSFLWIYILEADLFLVFLSSVSKCCHLSFRYTQNPILPDHLPWWGKLVNLG